MAREVYSERSRSTWNLFQKMSDAETTPQPEIFVDAAGRRFNARSRQAQLEGAARGAEKNARTFALQRLEDSGATAMAEARALCQAAMPRVMRHMVSIATGQVAKAPAVARVAAGKFVAEVGQQPMGAAPGGGNAKPLSEMTVSELEAGLRAAADAAHELRAVKGDSYRIDSESDSVPEAGSEAGPPEAPDASAP